MKRTIILAALVLLSTSFVSAESTLYFAQMADGGGYVTQFSLFNPGDSSITATVNFYRSDGSGLAVTMGSTTASVFTYTIPAQGSLFLRTSGTAKETSAGWARVSASGSIGGSLIYRYIVGGSVVSEAGLDPSPLLGGFTFPVDTRQGYYSGIAVANPSLGIGFVTVQYRLYSASGTLLRQVSEQIGALNHRAKLIGEIFPDQNFSEFTGKVVVSVSGGQVIATTLRFDGALISFASIPVTPIVPMTTIVTTTVPTTVTSSSSSTTSTSATTSTKQSTTTTKQATSTTSTSTTSTLPGPRSVFGTGIWLVGTDIKSGRYFNVPSSGCYWKRLSGLGGTLDEIISNEYIDYNAGQWIVDIATTDKAFSTDQECNTWYRDIARTGLLASVGQGMWLVGTQITPGTYRTTAQSGCYWERLRNFSGNIDGVIANDYVSSAGTQMVAISASDAGFMTDNDCGTWVRLTMQTEIKPAKLTSEIKRNWELNRAGKVK